MRAWLMIGLAAMAAPAVAETPTVPRYAVALQLFDGSSTVAQPNLIVPADQSIQLALPDAFGDIYTVGLVARPFGADGHRALLRYRVDWAEEPMDGRSARRSYGGVAVVRLGEPTAIALDNGTIDADTLRMGLTVDAATE